MGKPKQPKQRRGAYQGGGFTNPLQAELHTPPAPPRAKAAFEPKTEAQRHYVSSIRHNKITFGVGPAGTGKTYTAARMACEMFLAKQVRKIVLCRPAVEAGESLGFLPGDINEKLAPYTAAYGPGFHDGMGRGHFEYLALHGQIEVVPLAFMQGRSFDEPTIILFDEAQNATPMQMKMVLTRLGEGARLVIDGDPAQTMIRGQSGLIDGLQRTRYIAGVGVAQFERADIVRSGIVREILDAYDAPHDAPQEDEQFELPGFIQHAA